VEKMTLFVIDCDTFTKEIHIFAEIKTFLEQE
jgi:hypothetical protein